MEKLDYPISFSVDYNGDWEYVNSLEDDFEDSDKGKEVINLIQKVVNENLLVLGERSEGTITITDDYITFEYKVCTELGEDDDDDVWEDYTLQIPNV